MHKIAMSAALAAMFATASTGLAQSWGVGVGIGVGPAWHYGPPPGYYGYGPPPGYYGAPVVRRAPPPAYYGGEPLVILGPAPPPAASGVSADAVFDALERAGYREFGPMSHRGALYRLRAVNREGDLVDLEISAHTGEIERELILAESRRPQPRTLSRPTPPEPAGQGRDPLVVY